MEKQEEFALEQVVWVKTGDKHEEPGTIIGCTSGSDNENGKSEILVRLHVSAYKLACDPSQLRSLDEESTSTSQRRISRRLTTSRSLITPSPRVDMLSEDDDDDQKPAAKRKQYDGTIESVSEDNAIFEGDAEASSPYFKRSKISEISSTDTQIYISEAERARKSFPKSNAAAIALQCDTDALSHSASDDDDEEDRPFTIDFAPTSRATCRRCDQSIFKGNLRVSHVPLFRGKPGFRVSRHLECAIFSEDIDKAEDVGGWKKLSTEDYEALVLRVEESKLEIAKENEELEPDELVQVAFQGETRKSPPGLVATLLPFQVEGHAWMYHQEVHVSEIRGGILADEMGMGKTIQTLATILDNRPVLQHCKTGTKHLSTLPDFELRKREESLWAASVKDWKHEMEMNNVPKKILPKKYGAARAGTLVVCPLIALSQWKAEIEKFSAPGSLTVGIYHGPNRTSEIPAEMIQKYDVLLTTYNVIEQDFRKMVSPNKVTCPNCSGKFKIDKLRIHLKYFCGETAQRTEAQSRQRRSQGRNRGNAKNKRPTSSMKSKKGNVTVVKKKKIIQAKRLEGYDSEGNISVGQGWTGQVEPTSMNRRPSRAAAQTASQKLTISVKEWGAKIPKAKGKAFDISDESNFSSVAESESTDTDSSSLEDEGLVDLRVSRRKTSATAFELAKQRQADAIAAAKKGKGMSFTPKKKPVGKKKDPPKWKSKKFDNESSSDDNVDDYAVDPMDGIDINELLEEAMAGSRCSLLHSFCWWRVVLDEAHFIKSRSSQTAASAFALTSIHRWCLSGTPLESH